MLRAQWYDATSDDGSKRRSYKILPDTVLVPLRTIIQEQGLEFMRGGSETGDSIFPDAMHACVMRHNFSNYT